MKKSIILYTLLIVFVCVGFIYLFKNHNPTAYGWQTSLVTNLAKLTDIFYFPYHFKSSSLPTYQLTINPDNYIALNQALPDPYQQRTLTQINKISVPAKFKYLDQEYDVDIRYRGFDFDHWVHPKKSWRIEFKDQKPFNGQTAINLVIPEDRGIYLEELSNFRAKKLGLLTPPSKFILLKVNQKTQGVYWQFEHWTPALLERHRLPLSNLYGEIDQPVGRHQKKSIYSSLEHWKKYITDDTFDSTNQAELVLLLDLLNHSSDQEFFQKLPFLLDIDSFLSWQAHSVLMSSNHQDSSHNIRLYWHPVFGKFFIFPWDVLGSYGWPVNYNPLVSRVLKNPDWLKRRNQILKNYVTDPDNLSNDLQYFDQLVAKTKSAILSDYLKFFSNYGYLQQTKRYRQQIIDQFQLIKQALDTGEPTQKLELDYQVLKADLYLEDKDQDMIQTKFIDFDNLFQVQSKTITFGPGTHYLNQTLIIKPGHQLIILPGARLSIAKGVSLVSFGHISAVGTVSQPIVITAQDQNNPWGVLAVVGDGGNQSQFQHLIIEHGREAVVNGISFTGALAIHGAKNTQISKSIFRYNHGDDGLNIKYADAQVSNSKFSNNDYDGFDLDFGNGLITNNIFFNNGNDGLDLGSASPVIENNLIDNSNDKCISLGETSSPKITNNTLKNCNMAIAVKDSSQPEIFNNTITNNHIGLASYQKKPIFPRLPFVFYQNHLQSNQIDFEEQEPLLRSQSQ